MTTVFNVLGLFIALALWIELLSWHLAAIILGRLPSTWPTLYRPFVWLYHKCKRYPTWKDIP